MNYIYTYWTTLKNKVIRDLTNPVLLSIATLRNFDPVGQVQVIDYMPENSNWEDYPNLLNFEVVPIKPKFSPMPQKCWATLSKVFDSTELMNDSQFSVIVDTDILWLDKLDVDLLDEGKFNCNKLNTGCWCYTSNSIDFIENWKSTIIQGIEDPNAAKQILDSYSEATNGKRFTLTEEGCYHFTRLQHAHRCYDPGLHLNGKLGDVLEYGNLDELSNLHLIGVDLPGSRQIHRYVKLRGAFCFLVKELYEAALSTLGNRLTKEFGNHNPVPLSEAMNDGVITRFIDSYQANKLYL
jgi:hypothetical protein